MFLGLYLRIKIGSLVWRYRKGEVKEALFQMHPDKALGPDGMTPTFFQKYWHIVGDDVHGLIVHFFNTWEILEGLNDTNLVLIPKKSNPIEWVIYVL